MTDRTVSLLVLAAIGIGALWAYHSSTQLSPTPKPLALPAVNPESVPLVTGAEPIEAIFTKAGCPVCHSIPGIAGAEGQVGPPLVLGTTGEVRLRDSSYRGHAKSVHEYVIESVLEPGAFVVPGYPPNTMPTWYGTKLSALAMEKIASYLERQTERGADP